MANRQFLNQVHWMQEIKSPSRHGEDQFLGACAGHRHRSGMIRGIVGRRLTALKPATHPLDGTLNFVVCETSSQQVLNELLRYRVGFSSADRGGDVFALAGGDVNGFNLATTLGELEANQHQGRLTRTLVPSRHVHKEIPGGVGDGGVISVDDGWKRKDVVVGVEDQGITVHALEEVGIINAFGVVEQDVIDAHGLVVGERYKLVRSIDGHHAERRCKLGEIVDADGGSLTTPAQGEMQFLLVVHQPFDEGFNFLFIGGYSHVSNKCTVNHRSDGRQICINGHGNAAGLDVEVGTGRCIVEKVGHGIGQRFTAQEVRSVGKDLDVELLFCASVNVGSQQGELIVDLFDVVFISQVFHQASEQRLRDRDGWQHDHLANQWGSGRSYPASRRPLTAAVSWFKARRCFRSSMSMLLMPMRRSSAERSSCVP